MYRNILHAQSFVFKHLYLNAWMHRSVSAVRVQLLQPYKIMDIISDVYSLILIVQLILIFPYRIQFCQRS